MTEARAQQRLILTAAVVGLGVLIGAAATASPVPQEATQQPVLETEPQGPAAPQTIPIAEIPSRAEAALAEAAAILPLLRSDPAITDIESRLPEIAPAVDAARAELDRVNLELASVRRIRDLRQVWSRHQSQLSEWQGTLNDRREALQASVEQLTDVRELWERTQQAVAEVDLPEGVGESIVEAIESLRTAEASGDQRLTALLTLETRISGQMRQVNEALRMLDAAEIRSRQRLLQRDSAPLWALASEVDDQVLISQAAESYGTSAEALRQFIVAEQDGLTLQAMLFVVLLVPLLMLRGWSKGWQEDDASLDRIRFVLSRPVSTAFLLTLFATSAVFEQPPESIRNLAWLLTLVPLLRLLPGIFQAALRPGLYGLLVLFICGHVLGLSREGSLFSRLVLLLVSGGGMATLFWFLRRPPWSEHSGLSLPWRLARRGFQLGAALLGAALLANVFGWLRLADLLVTGTIRSAYGAVLVYVFAAALTGIVAALPYTPVAARLHSVRRRGDLITLRAATVIGLIALILWLRAAARSFDLLEPLARGLESMLTSSVTAGSLSLSVGKLLTVVVILWLAHLISRLARFVLQEEVFPRLHVAVGEADAVQTLTRYVILAIGIVAAAAALGIAGTQIAVLIGALGVGIGFGLQNIVNNFISGLILIFERPIKVGDMVEIGQLLGIVKQIGIRASVVRTFDGAEVVVPNGDLIAKEVVNWTLSDQVRRRELKVGVAYGTDPERVLGILRQVAAEHPEVLEEPEPLVLFLGFGESRLDFSLRYWTTVAASLRVSSEIAVAANAALKEAGITIPFPQRDVRLRSRDDAGPRGDREPGSSEADGGKPGASKARDRESGPDDQGSS